MYETGKSSGWEIKVGWTARDSFMEKRGVGPLVKDLDGKDPQSVVWRARGETDKEKHRKERKKEGRKERKRQEGGREEREKEGRKKEKTRKEKKEEGMAKGRAQ